MHVYTMRREDMSTARECNYRVELYIHFRDQDRDSATRPHTSLSKSYIRAWYVLFNPYTPFRCFHDCKHWRIRSGFVFGVVRA